MTEPALRYVWREWVEAGIGHWALMPEWSEIKHSGFWVGHIRRLPDGRFSAERNYRRSTHKTLAAARRWILRQPNYLGVPLKLK